MEKNKIEMILKDFLQGMSIDQSSSKIRKTQNNMVITINKNFKRILLLLLNILGKNAIQFELMYTSSPHSDSLEQTNIDEVIITVPLNEVKKLDKIF